MEAGRRFQDDIDGHLLDGRPFRGTILLGHLHWDHTQGLPFFPAAEHPESRVRVLIPTQGDPTEVLGQSMAPPHFPLRPEELRGTWEFGSIDEGRRPSRGSVCSPGPCRTEVGAAWATG